MNSTYIIAEIGMNHNGSLGQAKAFIKAAAETGVSAVKFQTHIAEAETLPDAPSPSYFKDESRIDYFKRTAFSLEEHLELKNYSESEFNVDFISSPFSFEAVDLLEEINIETYKIPSGEVTNIPMLEKIAKTGKKIILSSGMSSYKELDIAFNTITKFNPNLTILQCSSQYPCPFEEVGLNVIPELKERYSLPVGLSDHTPGISASIAAVVVGAEVIEKHFTLSKKLYGPDAKYSLEPDEFTQLVNCIHEASIMIDNLVNKDDISKYNDMKYTFEKSIVSIKDIKKGEIIDETMIGIKKPGGGIKPECYNYILGKRALKDIKRNRKILHNNISKEYSN